MHSTDKNKKTLPQYEELNTIYKELQEKIKQNLLFKNGVVISVFSNKYIKYYHKNKDLVDKIVEITSFIERPDITFQERVFCIFNNLYEVPKCKNCGGVTKFRKGYSYIEHCCRECKDEQQKGKYVGEKSCKRILSYNRVKEILGDNLLTKYDEYKGRSEDIEVMCKVCEDKYLSKMMKEVFRKDPGHCPKCNTKISLPVREICDYLKQNNIKYITEFRFKGCINPETGYSLPFDIYLPEKDVIIEYDGPHHILPVYGEEPLRGVIYRDRIKNEWCINNGKILLRIPHTVHNYVSYTHSFLQNSSPKYEIYSNNEYNNDIIELRDYIESFGYKDYIIFGIYRGSLQPAVHLSNVTNARKNIGIIQFQSYDGDDKVAKIICEGGDIDKNTAIFVIDDIYDTGNTINKVKKKMKYKYKHNNIHYATLFGKPNDEGVYYVRENKNFVIFPWEIITDTRCKVCKNSEPCRDNPETYSHCNIKNKSFKNSETCSEFISK